MGVKEELVERYGQDISIVTKGKGPYNVHVALREFGDGSTRVMGIKSEKNRPALLGSDKFFNPVNMPMTFDTTEADKVKEVIDQRL